MEKAEAYDERFEEVGWGHTTCEGGEQGSASSCGVAGGKGLNQGESGLPKHVPNPVSGKRATGGGPDTESFCRQSPEVGAGWFNDHVRICAGGAQQCAFLPQPRGASGNRRSYRNSAERRKRSEARGEARSRSRLIVPMRSGNSPQRTRRMGSGRPDDAGPFFCRDRVPATGAGLPAAGSTAAPRGPAWHTDTKCSPKWAAEHAPVTPLPDNGIALPDPSLPT